MYASSRPPLTPFFTAGTRSPALVTLPGRTRSARCTARASARAQPARQARGGHRPPRRVRRRRHPRRGPEPRSGLGTRRPPPHRAPARRRARQARANGGLLADTSRSPCSTRGSRWRTRARVGHRRCDRTRGVPQPRSRGTRTRFRRDRLRLHPRSPQLHPSDRLDAARPAAQARHAELAELRLEAHTFREALEAREAIEREKGILMAKEGPTESQAFERLRRASRRSGRPRKVIADAVAAKLS